MTDDLGEILELTDGQLLERLGALLLDDGLGFGHTQPKNGGGGKVLEISVASDPTAP
jgi:hypothetical protein